MDGCTQDTNHDKRSSRATRGIGPIIKSILSPLPRKSSEDTTTKLTVSLEELPLPLYQKCYPSKRSNAHLWRPARAIRIGQKVGEEALRVAFGRDSR